MKHVNVVLMFTLLSTLLFIGASLAQEQSRIEHRIQRLRELLSLTDAQTAQVKAIMEKSEQQATQDKAKVKGDKRQLMKTTRKNLAAVDKEVEAILTPEQLKKYETYKKARRDGVSREWRKGKGSEYNY